MNFNTVMLGIKEWFVESKCIILEANVDECLVVNGEGGMMGMIHVWDTSPPRSNITT